MPTCITIPFHGTLSTSSNNKLEIFDKIDLHANLVLLEYLSNFLSPVDFQNPFSLKITTQKQCTIWYYFEQRFDCFVDDNLLHFMRTLSSLVIR